ncbi:MAG: hypothetical protein IJS01_01560 [Lentisphaeria bacterium]|nr:hypothetical protein [Lentisphaeria bacterium]
MTKKTMLFATALLTGAVFAGEIYKAEIADLVPPKRAELKDGVFRAAGKTIFLRSKTSFAVDPAKKYAVSGEFRFPGTTPNRFYLGLMPLNAKLLPIGPENIHVIPGTETTLAAPAAVGDTSVKIADGEKWDNKRFACAVAFNVKDDYADLPNATTAGMKKGSVKKNGDVWEIELEKPLKTAYAAGTRVRQHLCGGTFIYSTIRNKKDLSGDWQKFSGTITGLTKNTRSDNEFWPGTAKAYVIVLTTGGADDTAMEFRDLKVEEAE